METETDRQTEDCHMVRQDDEEEEEEEEDDSAQQITERAHVSGRTC